MYRQPNTSASTYPSDNRWSSQSQQAPLFFSPRKRSPNNSDSDSDTKGPALLARTIMEHNKNINSNHRPQAVAKKPTAEIWWAWLRKLLKDIITFPLLLLSGYIILGIMFGIAVYTLGLLIMAGKYGKCRLSHSEWYCSRQLGGFWDR